MNMDTDLLANTAVQVFFALSLEWYFHQVSQAWLCKYNCCHCCPQSFKNILSYMGDRDSSKLPSGHVKTLIKNALNLPIQFNDEVPPCLLVIRPTPICITLPFKQIVKKNFSSFVVCICFLLMQTYCQLAKQTTGNTNPRSRLKGWQLLAICCGILVPHSPLFL